MRRDDLLPSLSAGNKFYKLYFNLQLARQLGAPSIVSFGGAYSNHLHALAALGYSQNLATIGVIRGELGENLSPTLADAQNWGMRLLPVSRKDYARRELSSILSILKQSGDYLLIPEGGDNLPGVRGCLAIAKATDELMASEPYTLCCASGTGATLAGLSAGTLSQNQVLGFSVLKGVDTTSHKVRYWHQLLLNRPCRNWQLISGYHHGGYARVTAELMTFMSELEVDNELLLDPVYTAKLLWGIQQLAEAGYWPRGAAIVALHSGGIQGRRGFNLSGP